VEIAMAKKTHEKSTAEYEVQTELIKYEKPEGHRWLYKVLKNIWKKRIPED
jgi:hypothetical protein